MTDTWESPEQEEGMRNLWGLLETTKRAPGMGLAIFPKEDGGWSIECVGGPLNYVDFEYSAEYNLPATSLGAEADELRYAAAVARRKLRQIVEKSEEWSADES